uniref:DH domain-containing protein n=1 Tax=Arcella intermedia TaxID=1963864 RepID=A0A6B2LDK1_9EUKA
MIRTEQSYVRNLNILYLVFKKPLQESLLVTEEHLNLLFYNVDEIIISSTSLLNTLVEQGKNFENDQTIAGSLLSLIPFLELYRNYTLNYRKCQNLRLELLEKDKIRAWLEKQYENPQCQNLTIESYLTLPIQRIPQYFYLLDEILKCTDGEDPEYEKIEMALSMVKEISEEVSVALKEQDQLETMNKISKKFTDYQIMKIGRIYYHDGELVKICRKERKKRLFYLFSDVLLYTQNVQAIGAKLNFIQSASRFQSIFTNNQGHP